MVSRRGADNAYSKLKHKQGFIMQNARTASSRLHMNVIEADSFGFDTIGRRRVWKEVKQD